MTVFHNSCRDCHEITARNVFYVRSVFLEVEFLFLLRGAVFFFEQFFFF